MATAAAATEQLHLLGCLTSAYILRSCGLPRPLGTCSGGSERRKASERTGCLKSSTRSSSSNSSSSSRRSCLLFGVAGVQSFFAFGRCGAAMKLSLGGKNKGRQPVPDHGESPRPTNMMLVSYSLTFSLPLPLSLPPRSFFVVSNGDKVFFAFLRLFLGLFSSIKHICLASCMHEYSTWAF